MTKYVRDTKAGGAMPEFILDHGTPKAAKQFAALDSFTQGYVETMFFTSTGHLEDGDLEAATVAELAPKTWDRIESDCARFQDDAKIIACIYNRKTEAGRDFWYTRNGHGVGFWDGDWPEPDSDYLDIHAHAFGEIDLYRGDDGRLYLS